MEQIECSETSAYKLQTPGNYPEENIQHSDLFNGIEILQGRWQHGEKVGYCYPSGLEKTLCETYMYVPLVTKGLI
jgi:hypothetical protein